ncbi:adenine phosphoribosyltransferase [Lapillicoccus sp.]|uniref:adenine phosphoribosyltransferase n=1 Tax=Lapillicoccus sp. TaxID=1909287 RepID=UPI0027BDB9F8|nr:adenine phosphoribosyltransferase [Actinomycetota bacterium]
MTAASSGSNEVSPIRELVLARMRDVADFPKPGVLFKDFTPLLSDGPAFAAVVRDIAGRYAGRIDVVVGIEARGFIIGAAVAYDLGVGFVPVRKGGKLPGPSLREEYTLEYGEAVLEMHVGALQPGQRALVLDDVLATGGTVVATCRLVERAGAVVEAIDVVLEIGFLEGRAKLTDRELHSIVSI